MTVTLTLEPEIEAAARVEAEARGIGVEDYLQAVLKNALPAPPLTQEDFAARVRSLAGVLSHLGPSRLMEDKQEEIAREERRWTSK